MDLSDVVKIVELEVEKDVNRYLDLGWKLLKLCGRDDSSRYPLYILGWLKSEEEPQYPEPRKTPTKFYEMAESGAKIPF